MIKMFHVLFTVVGDIELIVELGNPGTIISPGYYYNRYPRCGCKAIPISMHLYDHIIQHFFQVLHIDIK